MPATGDMHIADRWVLSRLNAAVTKANSSLETWDFTGATSAMHSFFIYDLCDVYLEWSKGVFTGDDQAKIAASRAVLWKCLDYSLKLMHPIMPFVTEELWQRLPKVPGAKESLVIEAYPVADEQLNDALAEEQMRVILDSARVARQMKDSYGLKRNAKPEAFIWPKSSLYSEVLPGVLEDIALLGVCGSVSVWSAEGQAEGCGMRPIGDQAECFIRIKGLVDVDAEVRTLNKKKAQHEKMIEGLQKKMSIPNYEDKVPQQVRDTNAAKLATLQDEHSAMQRSLELFESLRE
jgi:valyl-tRNA synthetase